MKKRIILPGYLLLAGILACSPALFAGNNFPESPFSPEFILASTHPTPPSVLPTISNNFKLLQTISNDTIPPIQDRQGDFISDPNRNPFDLKDPVDVQQTIEYDPVTGQYIITEKIGDDFFRPPTYMTFEEFMDYQAKKQEREYFNELNGLGDTRSSTGRLDPIAKVDVKNQLIDRLFGGTEVDIRPQGNIDLTFGVEFSNVKNPAYTRRQQRQGGFDFDMQIQMNVQGQIGSKLKLATNYNTQATFDFDNTMKLDYGNPLNDQFSEDDIIKKIEAGNVSLPLRSQLIQGSQSLFGLKTELQFGRLRLTAVASQQKSEQEEVTLQGGSQYQDFEVFADSYDENRHFFLTHYNRNNFEEALSELPQIKSIFKISRLQVWVTNTRSEWQDVRDIVAIADLGETERFTNRNPAMQEPFQPAFDLEGKPLPHNYANPIYPNFIEDPDNLLVDRATNVLRNQPFNFQQGRDYEKVSARQLSPTEFSYDPLLGYISLNITVQPDQVVGVAFEYTYQDENYKIGQLAEQVPYNEDTTKQNVLVVKMLKSSTQRVDLPTWDLMMKNIYSTGAYNVSREDFKLDVFYEDPGEGQKRFLDDPNLPAGIKGKPLLRFFNLDRLNTLNDPQPDGIFDFVEGITINSRTGRVMFPVLEPFGQDLVEAFGGDPVAAAKYAYPMLYDSTITKAREFPEFNRFTLEGTYKSSVTNEISLGAFNIPEGSVNVTAGGQILEENVDYIVDYNLGKVKITNSAILASGQPIKVSFEDNTLFGFQTKTMLGLRADYELNKHITLGATYLHLFERPFTQKVNIGDDPINNRIFGLDMNYSNEAPWLTKLVDKLPFLSTKEKSTITFAAETAALKPGHAKAINEDSADDDKGGVNYLDDFDGSGGEFDLRTLYSPNGWVLSSIPQNDDENNNPLFPESDLKDTFVTGVNRAHLSWYRVDFGANGNDNDAQNPYSLRIQRQEIERNYVPPNTYGNTYAQIMDLRYDPTRRGSYNFDLPGGTPFSAGLSPEGRLLEPESRWAGIMRSIPTNDFEAANYEFVDFWLMSPYLDTTGADGANPDALDGGMNGYLYFNFGNISEDILPDSRRMFENGIPVEPGQENRMVKTNLGNAPLAQQITDDFDVNPDNREKQDIGLDGLNDQGERDRFNWWLNSLGGVAGDFVTAATADPSNDNFVHFDDNRFDNQVGVHRRYDRFSKTEGNSPVQSGNSSFTTAGTQRPDAEDIDSDRTLNETESYFQYKVPIESDPSDPRRIRTDNNPFITEFIESEDGGRRIWYRFRIPLQVLENDSFFQRVGGIRDFRSIRFVRMYMHGFEKWVPLRFGTLELVRNQWRRYTQNLGEPCVSPDPSELFTRASLQLTNVDIQESSRKLPFGYILPPGISREQALGVNTNALQNEGALSLKVCDLEDGDARAIFKNLNLDMRYFSKLKMFVHGEQTECGVGYDEIQDGELSVFIRLGSDFKNNYYEYELPLKISTDVTVPYNDRAYPRVVWPVENDFEVDFEALKDMKLERNNSGVPLGQVFESTFIDPNKPGVRMRIKGNPNLGLVKSVMIGIRNPLTPGAEDCDPSDKKSVEVWVNELRVFGLDERGGVAGIARLDMQLADLGSVTLSGKMSSIGFGALDQQLAQRSREQITQYDLAAQVKLDKFLPEKVGVSIPFYFQYSKEARNPQYDPYDLDVELKEKLKEAPDNQRDSLREQAQTVTTIKSYNFTNVRKEPSQKAGAKQMPWSISNFSFTYAFDETTKSDPIIAEDKLTRRRGAMDYSYSRPVKYIEPFKKAIKKDKYLKWLKEVNFNPLPNSFNFSTDLDRRFGKTVYRFSGTDPLFNTYYNKQFLWNRTYDLKWDFTKNLKMTFNADNAAAIDEPNEQLMYERHRLLNPGDPGYIADIKEYRRDSIWRSIRDFGRTKSYQHQLNLTYTVPLKNFPFLDWVGVKASYQAGYNWDAASETPFARELGNVIRNRQGREINADFDFEKLYNYSAYLKKLNTKARPKSGNKDGRSGGDPGGSIDRDPGGGGMNPNDRSGGKGDTGGLTGGGKSKSDRQSAREQRRQQKADPSQDPNAQGGQPDMGIPGKDPSGKGDIAGGADKGGRSGNNNKAGKAAKEKGKKGDGEPGTIERVLIRPLMMVRKLRASYKEDFTTTVPHYMPDSKLFGMEQFEAPGWAFVAGWQPNINQGDYYTGDDWLYQNYQWISKSLYLNQNVQQTYQQQIDAKLTLEPFPDFRIDVEANRKKGKNHSETFGRIDDIGETQQDFFHQSPRDFGSFSVSYAALNTFFKNDDQELDDLFNEFERNRVVVSQRLGDGAHDKDNEAGQGFTKGYGRAQQNVVLPSFFAAYTGEDINAVKLSDNYLEDVLLEVIPRPNWRLTYNGLSKLGFFKEVFSSFTLTHGYKGTLNVNSFQTSLDYEYGEPVQDLHETTYNYFSRYEIPDLIIQEQFAPLFGVDMRLKNDMSFKVEYKASRTLALEVSRQLEETNGKEMIIGFGYKLKEVKLGFLSKKKGKKKTNAEEEKKKPGASSGGAQAGDFDFTFDFSLRDDLTTVRPISPDPIDVPARGNRTLSILPQATYQVNKQLSLRFFFDYRKNVPKTSQGFPTTNVRSGVTVRFSLN